MTRYTLDRGRYPRAWRKHVLYTEQQLRRQADRNRAELKKQAAGTIHMVHPSTGKVLAVFVEASQDDGTTAPERLRALASLKVT